MDFAHGAAIALFLLATFGVALVGYFNSDQPYSASEFFHSSNDKQNVVSLFVATVTVASGVGYLLAGGQINGPAMLAVPFAMLVGYRLLAYFYGQVVSPSFIEYPSFWAGAQMTISKATGKKSIVGLILTVPLAIIFVLFCAFELLVSAQIISAILFKSPSLFAQMAVASAMFLSPLAITARGGVRGVFKADALQFVGIVLFALVFGIAAILAHQPGEVLVRAPTPLELMSSPQLTVTLVLAILASVLTQFYSTVNHHTASNVAGDNRVLTKVLTRTAVMLVIFFSVMVLIGAYSGVQWTKGLPLGVDTILTRLPIGGFTSLLLGLVVVGLVCVTVTTLQSLMMGVTLQIYGGVLGLDSKATSKNVQDIWFIRKLMLGIFGSVILLSALAFYTNPSIFYTLLAIASGAEALVPLIILIGFLSRRPSGLGVLSNSALLLYPMFFVSAIVSNLILAKLNPELVPFVSLAHFCASTLYSILLARTSASPSAVHRGM